MSDEALRALERRWLATGDAVDGAAWLAERVRTGELARERLEVAAYLGHDAARAAVGACALSASDELEPWLRRIKAWEKPAVVRAALVALKAVAEDAQGLPPAERDDLRRVAEAVETWLVCPCAVHGTLCLLLMRFGAMPPGRELPHALLEAAYHFDMDCVTPAVTVLELASVALDAAQTRARVATALASHALRVEAPLDDSTARHLVHRCRQGTLAPERLRLAAVLGDPAALRAVGLRSPIHSMHLCMAIEELGAEATACASRAAKVAAGLKETTRGVSFRAIPDDHVGRWLDEAGKRVGREPVDRAVREAVIRWALAEAEGEGSG